jgi:cytochrome c553
MVAKANQVETWLERQLSDGKEQAADGIVIRGMMAGYSEQRIRRAAQALHVRHPYTPEPPRGTSMVERWQLPTREP